MYASLTCIYMYMEQVKKILHNLCKKIWLIELKINSVKKQFYDVK